MWTCADFCTTWINQCWSGVRGILLTATYLSGSLLMGRCVWITGVSWGFQPFATVTAPARWPTRWPDSG